MSRRGAAFQGPNGLYPARERRTASGLLMLVIFLTILVLFLAATTGQQFVTEVMNRSSFGKVMGEFEASLDRMRDELGFVPSYSAEEALHELGAWRRSERSLSGAELLAQKESRFRATIAYRQRRGRTEENEAYE